MKEISFLAALIVLTSCGPREKTIQPTVKPLVEAVYASGYVVSKNEYEVFSQAEGYVLEKVVEDGAEVKRGEPLFILESGQQNSRFQMAQKNFSIAARNYSDQSPILNEAKSAMETALTKFRYDSINHNRFKNLLAQNATSKGEYDRARLTFESSANEYRAQKSRYERLKNQLYLELENAKSGLEIAGNESGKYIIRSEVDGKVFKTLKEKGELVRRGEAIAVIGDRQTFYLELNVDELDIQLLKVGQEVIVTIDALSDEVYHAKVDKIYPMVNRQQQAVRVDAVLSDSVPVFYSGLAVEANIIIRRKQNALVVPRTALVGSDSLRIETDDGVKTIKVKKGIETLEEVEILEGIETNTPVISIGT